MNIQMKGQSHESFRDRKGQSIIPIPKKQNLRQKDLVSRRSQEAILLLHLARFRPLKDNYICFWKIRDI